MKANDRSQPRRCKNVRTQTPGGRQYATISPLPPSLCSLLLSGPISKPFYYPPSPLHLTFLFSFLLLLVFSPESLSPLPSYLPCLSSLSFLLARFLPPLLSCFLSCSCPFLSFLSCSAFAVCLFRSYQRSVNTDLKTTDTPDAIIEQVPVLPRVRYRYRVPSFASQVTPALAWKNHIV